MHQAGRGFSLRRENALALKAGPHLFEKRVRAPTRFRRDSPKRLADRTPLFLQATGRGACPKGSFTPTSFPITCSSWARSSRGSSTSISPATILAYDLSVCLNAWCFELDGSFNVSKGAAMIALISGCRT